MSLLTQGWDGGRLLRCRDLCHQDTLGDEEPHSGTTEAG